MPMSGRMREMLSWTGDEAAARALQSRLAGEVVPRDGFATPLRLVAGFDLGFEDGGRTTRAAAVLLDAGTLQPLASEVARLPASMPYVPGLLGFRALPALLAALDALPERPGLAFVDGHGIAHPRGLGIASLFGVATGVPSIGVATAAIAGDGIVPHQTRGAYTALRVGRRQVGWLLRSQVDRPPLVVSPGHLVALASAADLVMRFVASGHMPEPMRLAACLPARQDAP